PGPLHSGRETVYHNGSLLLRNVTRKDTGFYTLQSLNSHEDIASRTTIYLHVHTSNCGCPSTCAQITIESVPSSIVEGESVLLVVYNLPENLRAFFWYKGGIVSKNIEVAWHQIARNTTGFGPAYSGREIVYSNGSLLLQNVTWKDTGFYTLRTLSRDLETELVRVQLQLDTSLSVCCNSLTSVQLMIEPVPQNAVKGDSVLFLVHNLPEDLRAFAWYKLGHNNQKFKIAEFSRVTNYITHGPAYSERAVVYTNGSLLLQDVMQTDAGVYVLQTLNRDFKTEKAYVQLHVYKPVTQPFIQVTSTTVTAQSSVVFTCLSGDTGVSICWIFNNRNLQLTERMTLSPTKCQLSIDPVRREDAGDYQCEVFNPVSSRISLPVSLAVTNE
uniref:Ig-like domain-containing protein n=1 Tax=Cricetulus griseus TaxID=10029 RepID=A0A8C2LLA5_CRIGR